MTDIYRTVYQIEVFSQGPFTRATSDADPFGLAGINDAITTGNCIGDVEIVDARSERVPPERVRDHLLRIGNDGTFFDAVDEEEA